MGCCSGTKNILRVAGEVVTGYTNLAIGKKYKFTDRRIRICQQCEPPEGYHYWVGRTLWCSICKCLVVAAARVKRKKCPKGKWPEVNGNG